MKYNYFKNKEKGTFVVQKHLSAEIVADSLKSQKSFDPIFLVDIFSDSKENEKVHLFKLD